MPGSTKVQKDAWAGLSKDNFFSIFLVLEITSSHSYHSYHSKVLTPCYDLCPSDSFTKLGQWKTWALRLSESFCVSQSKSSFVKKHLKHAPSCVKRGQFHKRETKGNCKRLLYLYIKTNMDINANGFENLLGMNGFLGNSTLAILSEEEIENQNRRLIKREGRTLSKEHFCSLSSEK